MGEHQSHKLGGVRFDSDLRYQFGGCSSKEERRSSKPIVAGSSPATRSTVFNLNGGWYAVHRSR